MNLGDTAEYQNALVALTELKEQYGTLSQLKPIFEYLIRSKDSPVAESRFAWTGTEDPRDRAVVQAYQEAFDRMVRGDDDFD